MKLLTSLQFWPSFLGDKRHCRGSDADQRQTCFVGTSEARLDGVAESVVLQEAVRVHTVGEVHAVYASDS